jgi:hypothetical protein
MRYKILHNLEILRRYFCARTLREQWITILFAIVVLLFWTGLLLKRYSAVLKERSKISRVIETQNNWLKNKSAIETKLGVALAHLSREKTYTSSRLVAKVDTLARAANLRYELAKPQTHMAETFEFHTLQLDVKQASIEELLAFDASIEALFPYISLSSVRINANTQNPKQLDCRLEITSIELQMAENA